MLIINKLANQLKLLCKILRFKEKKQQKLWTMQIHKMFSNYLTKNKKKLFVLLILIFFFFNNLSNLKKIHEFM